MQYEVVIGLEVHAQLKVNTKIFCGCSIEFGADANTHGCPVCLGHPGTLPVLNKKAVDFTIKTGLATNHTINYESIFARKNYFYPDLPKGYQISQFDKPTCTDGHLNIYIDDVEKRIGITRIHMEEDAGKLKHDGSIGSMFDVNRAGTPLMEIVSEPDMRSAKEAYEYLNKLKQILIYLDVCDGNMEEGSMRCDANVSLRPVGQKEFGTRTETKNLNSFSNVERAINYEIERQTAVLENGGVIDQETRLWDANKGVSRTMRSKEDAHDYRYFPEPDLVPLIIDEEWIESIRKELPELPHDKINRFIEQYSLPRYDAELLCQTIDRADYFEKMVENITDYKGASNWMLNEILKIVNEKAITIKEFEISPEKTAGLLKEMAKGTISGKIAKTVFQDMLESGKDAQTIISEKGLVQISNTDELKPIVQEIFDESPKEVEAFLGGKQQLMGFFVGQLMKRTKGKANPKLANQIIQEMFDALK